MHPSIQLEVARWRHDDLLPEAEMRRLAKLAEAGQRHDRGLRMLIGGRASSARRQGRASVPSAKAWRATADRANENSTA